MVWGLGCRVSGSGFEAVFNLVRFGSICAVASEQRGSGGRVFTCTSLTKNCFLLEHYSRTMPEALRCSKGGGHFLVSQAPLQGARSCSLNGFVVQIYVIF